jgi:hypothetical protein
MDKVNQNIDDLLQKRCKDAALKLSGLKSFSEGLSNKRRVE